MAQVQCVVPARQHLLVPILGCRHTSYLKVAIRNLHATLTEDAQDIRLGVTVAVALVS